MIRTLVVFLIPLLLLQGGAHGCSFQPVNPLGPWIGGFAYSPEENSLVTTHQKGKLVSNMIVYRENGSTQETTVVINADTGRVKKRGLMDCFMFTQEAEKTKDVTAGYHLKVDNYPSTNANTTVFARIKAPNGIPIHFSIQDDSGVHIMSYSFRFVISKELNTAYFIGLEKGKYAFSKYAVLDLSAAQYVNNPIIKLREFPESYTMDWPPDQYSDLQLMSLWNGDSCYGRLHLHYNRTHLDIAKGMGYYTFTKAIDRGDKVKKHSYYTLEYETEVVGGGATTGDLYAAQDTKVVSYTLFEKNVITGKILRQVDLDMDNIQDIANSMRLGRPRQHLRSGSSDAKRIDPTQGGNCPNGLKRMDPTNGGNQTSSPDLSTLQVKSTMTFEFFQGQGRKPNREDLGDWVGETQEFFRRVFQHNKKAVDITITNVKGKQDQSAPDLLTLEFVSNVVQEGNCLTGKEAADLMAGSSFKHYIGDYLTSSGPGGLFHSTFKVFFKGISTA